MIQKLIKGWSATLVIAGSLATLACSSDQRDDGFVASSVVKQLEQPPPAALGELLARVDLTETHYVEFRGVAGGKEGLGIIEFGQQGV